MTIAQSKAARRKFLRDEPWRSRYKPRKGNRAGIYANASQRRAAAKNRKRVQMGGTAGSIGFGNTTSSKIKRKS